jgi:hypothetical protein
MSSFTVKLVGTIETTDEQPCVANVKFTCAESQGLKIKGDLTAMELREGQKVKLSVRPLTANGNPAGIEEGSAEWTSSDSAIVSVEIDTANPFDAWARGVNGSNNASANIEFRADGDQDAGPNDVNEIVGTLAVTCTQGDAVTVEIEAGEPTDDDGSEIDNSLPSGGARPDQGLPNAPEIDNSLPSSGARPDQGLPDDQPEIDNALPSGGGRVDNTLPEHGAPKRRK